MSNSITSLESPLVESSLDHTSVGENTTSQDKQHNGAALTTAALLGGAVLLSGKKSAQAAVTLTFSQIDGTGDIKVLNYALALEALEADLYDQALKRLTTGGTNGLGRAIPGLNISPTSPSVRYVSEFRQVEVDHRDFLNAQLGANSIIGATGSLRNAKFDFDIQNKNERQILDLLITVEALGVQAYLGAIPLFATAKFLPIAAAIQGTEARHTAAIIVIRNQLSGTRDSPAPLYNEGLSNKGIDVPLEPNAVLAAAGQFIVL